MALVTIERTSPSPQESESEDQGSLSSHEGFVCREGCVFSLSPRPGVSVGKYGVMPLRIMTHLKKVVKLMRPQDSLKLAVELEQPTTRNVSRYMSLITTLGVQDTEESIILGTEQKQDSVLICLVLPLLRDTEIKLNGDGGFSVHSYDKQYDFKPCSVQSMWTALQSMFKSIEQARTHNYFVGGLSHTWMTYYNAQLTEDGVSLNEWSVHPDFVSFRPDSPIYFNATRSELSLLNAEKESFRKYLVGKLREIMFHCDLEVITSKQLRIKLEAELKMDLREYKGYLDQQMLVILGQMEKPSKIHDYLYLGSEWNAADLDGLKELGIGYILNVTREIDNFYPEVFKYKSIRLYDVPQSELLMHWEATYSFIKEAKEANSKVLVHCKMGISRSAATTIAFTMKEYRMSLEDAFKQVKSCRNIINPNHGFMNQLKAYEGILKARYNTVFGCQVPSRITYHNRCSSDSNVRQRLFQEGMEFNGYFQQKNEDGQEEDEEEEGEGGIHMRAGSQIDQVLENKVWDTLPPEKVQGMVNYLASLPVPEEDQDLGINVPSSSESCSPFSSPLLTPPDVEGMQHMLKEFQEAERDRLGLPGKDRSEDDDERESSSTLLAPHSRVGRATSLPTQSILLGVSSLVTEAYPKQPSPPQESSDSEEKEDKEPLVEETDGEGVKTTLIQSVTERIKEIERISQSLTSERPASAGSRKYMSCGTLSLASSEESLHSKKFTSMSDDNGVGYLQREKRRSMSPVSNRIPENGDVDNSSKDDTLTRDIQACTVTGHMSPRTAFRVANLTSQALAERRRNLHLENSDHAHTILMVPPVTITVEEEQMADARDDVHSESLPTSSNSSYMYNNDSNQYADNESSKSITTENTFPPPGSTIDSDSLPPGNDRELSDDDNPQPRDDLVPSDSPGTRYKIAATKRALLLEERKKTMMESNSPVSVEDPPPPVVVGRRVKELSGMFDGETNRSPKRTQSLRERPLSLLYVPSHKRTSSSSIAPSKSQDSLL